MTKRKDFLFRGGLSYLDKTIDCLVRAEEQRHQEKLVMIASESLCPDIVLEALATVFTSKYAEGYPSLRMTQEERSLIEEDLSGLKPCRTVGLCKAGMERHLAFHRRYGDRRFYKGAEYSNFIEVLAQYRAAQVMANDRVPAERIFVNVQPLSGAAANNAIYNAFVLPGDTVMGMSLSYGGHLTHGSPFNRSGQQHRIIPYVVDMKTGRLDYNRIRQLALEHKPKLIIAGASAYPWDIDWSKLREIADCVPVQIPGLGRPGAILMADIAHTAGLIVAGLFPNPVGYADVVTMTTHKTLCGPRGAVIISTNEEITKRVDLGVFPGEQGGPHINQIAAKAVCFKLAATPEFKELQKRIVENCQVLADALRKLGFKLAYGGTNTHLLLIDLDSVKTESGIAPKGDIVSDILDLCGITCNKNTLPGDETGARPRGIRLGTTILSQRGMGKPEMVRIAGLIHKVITNLHTFKVFGPTGEVVRGKVPLAVMETVRHEVRNLVRCFPIDTVHRPVPTTSRRVVQNTIEIIGERATAFLQGIVTDNIFNLKADDSLRTSMLDGKGKLIDEVIIQRLKDTENNFQHYLMAPNPSKVEKVMNWLTNLSDGYVLFDEVDVNAKIDGPVVLHLSGLKVKKPKDRRIRTPDLTKSYFIGQRTLFHSCNSRYLTGQAPTLVKETKNVTQDSLVSEEKKTCLYEEHLKLTKKHFMVNFAGWSMPVWYSRMSEEHLAVRQAAGLFDVSHMGRLEIKGSYATPFLDLITTNYVPKLKPGLSQYSYILDTHGNVMDDIFLYCLGINHYLMVVNAVNSEKIRQWVDAVNEKRVIIDNEYPGKKVSGKVNISYYSGLYSGDTRDTNDDPNRLVNVALQGPNSLAILGRLIPGQNKHRTFDVLVNLKRLSFAEFDLGGIKSLVARTGYTGEEVGFEIFVKAGDVSRFWNLLLDQGKIFGLKPCGLAARDATRIEAGFPLYGHELAGIHNITPTEAGYGVFIKRYKPFFIGRSAYMRKEAGLKNTMVRFQVKALGVKKIENGQLVANRYGEHIGFVTSCSLIPMASGQSQNTQIGLAYVAQGYDKEGTQLGIYTMAKRAKESAEDERVMLTKEAIVVKRFPMRIPH